MSDEDLSPTACWAMFRNMPDQCDAPILAGAFLHAAKQGWLPDDLVGGLPIEEPNASEKLRARVAFLHLCHAADVPIAAVMAVLEAVPDRWLSNYSAPQQLVFKLGMEIGSGESLSEADRDRYRRICSRADGAAQD